MTNAARISPWVDPCSRVGSFFTGGDAHDFGQPGTSPAEPLGAGGPTSSMNQVRFLEAEVTDLRRRLGDAPGHSRGLELRLADTQRSLAAVTVPERAARRDAARGARPDHEAQGGGRPAGPAAGRLRHLPEPQRGRLDRRLHRRPQAAGQREPDRRARRPRAWPGGHAQRGAQRRRRPRVRGGRRGRDVQGAARRRRPRPGHRQRRRGARRTARRAAARPDAARRRLPAARLPRGLRLREGARSPRSRSSSSRRSRTSTTVDRRPGSARSSRSATRSSCPTCTPSCSSSTS